MPRSWASSLWYILSSSATSHLQRYGSPQAGTLYGRLESNYPDALVLEIVEHEQPNGSRILIYKRAIVAVEAHGTMTP